jgi:Double zinc ribbon
MTCSGCTHVNEAGRRYCGQCGLDNRPACVRCGFGNSATDRFCGGCGNAMSVAKSAATGPSSGMAPAARRVSALPPPPTSFAAAARANDPAPLPAVAAFAKPAVASAPVAAAATAVDVDGILSAAELQLLITPKAPAASKAEPELAKDHVTQDDLDSLFEANS